MKVSELELPRSVTDYEKLRKRVRAYLAENTDSEVSNRWEEIRKEFHFHLMHAVTRATTKNEKILEKEVKRRTNECYVFVDFLDVPDQPKPLFERDVKEETVYGAMTGALTIIVLQAAKEIGFTIKDEDLEIHDKDLES